MHASTGRNIARLPPELVFSILEWDDLDKTTLQHCSLVCRDWVAPASSRLFYLLVWPPRCRICSTREGDTVSEVCDTDAHTCTLSSFLQSVALSPRVLNNIRKLHLFPRNPHQSASAQDLESISFNDLIRIISSVPCLCALGLTDCLLHPSTSPPQIVTQSVTRLDHLRIAKSAGNDGRTPSLSAIIQLLSYFTQVTRLSFQGTVPSYSLISHTRTHSTHISSLEMNLSSTPADLPSVTKALSTQVDFLTINSLTLHLVTGKESNVVRKILRSTPNITDLSVSIFDTPLTLNPATRLRSLSVSFQASDLMEARPQFTAPAQPMRRLARSFSALETSHLKEVSIILAALWARPARPVESGCIWELWWQLRVVDWTALAACFARCAAAKVLRLTLHIVAGPEIFGALRPEAGLGVLNDAVRHAFALQGQDKRVVVDFKVSQLPETESA